MNYIEVTAWGNNKKHLILLNKIEDISFSDEFTTLKLSGGTSINIIEEESIIKEMLSYCNIVLISESKIKSFNELNQYQTSEYNPDDELPF